MKIKASYTINPDYGILLIVSLFPIKSKKNFQDEKFKAESKYPRTLS